ncbi:MAG: hypothetical protein ACI4GC_07525, partial [Acutalibacteraceae bacterium]
KRRVAIFSVRTKRETVAVTPVEEKPCLYRDNPKRKCNARCGAFSPIGNNLTQNRSLFLSLNLQ